MSTPLLSVHAADIFYDDTGGNFGDALSWVGGSVPGATDAAIFDTGDPGLLLSFFANRTIQAMDIQDVDVTFDLSGFDLTMTTFRGLDVGTNANTSSAATFTGGVVTTTNIDVRAPTGGTADLTLTGADTSLVQTGFNSTNIGDNLGGGSASLNVENGATFTTSAGTFRVFENGDVDVEFGSNMNINGNILIDGGTVTGWSDNSRFNWAAGQTMTVENGGQVSSFSSSYDSPNNSTWVVTGTGSRVFGSGNTMDLTTGSAIIATAGGSWDKGVRLLGGSTLTADGPGTTLDDFSVADGAVTMTNQVASNGFFYEVGDSVVGTGTLDVLSGSTLIATSTSTSNSVASFQVSNDNNEGEGIVNISGGGSSVQGVHTQIGSASGNNGTVNITNGGSFTATASTTLNATGTFNITNGTAQLGDFIDNGGTVNFNSGTFGHNGDLSISVGGLVGSSINTSSKSLILGGTVTVDAGASLSVDGGILSAGAVTNFGDFSFDAGTLEITNSDLNIDTGGLLGRRRVIDFNDELIVTQNLNVASTGLLSVSGGRVSAGTLNNAGQLELGSFGAVVEGGTLNNHSIVTGRGVIDSTLMNSSTGEVRVLEFNNLDFTASGNTNNGLIYTDGGVLRFTGDLTNNSSGVISVRGQIRFADGLTNDGDLNFGPGISDAFGAIANTSQGQISAAGGANVSFFGDVMNAGDIFVGFDSRATFFAGVSGAGSFSGTGVVEFTDGFSPGASPATVTFGGDVALAGSTDLLIELGGLIAGSEFDQLDIAGDITLDGVLDIALINGFTPSPGNTFQIINAGSRTGEFDSITGNDLGGGVMLDVIYSATGVTLEVIGGLPGDLDGDGFVGINDLNIVLGNWNQNVPPANPLADPSGDGFVGIDDLGTVLGNWNAGTPPTVSQDIPEPGTLGLLVVMGSIAMYRKEH